MHPLDNVIWRSLTTTHARFAETHNSARKFVKEVSLLGGFAEPAHENYASLAALLGPDERVGLFLAAPPDPPPGWTIFRVGPLLQMIHENNQPSAASQCTSNQFIPLGPPDVPEMLELTRLTKPGPFATRTHELGDFVGIRQSGKLIAMAGERLRVPGFTEISAVCTHPDHLGHGYARSLMALQIERIRDRGEQPFLHVLPENTRAVELYERLGFIKRALHHYAVLQKAA